MTKDLTNSAIDRQNILNNGLALQQIQKHLNLGGIAFDGDVYFTKQQLTAIYAVSDSTVERYIKNHAQELQSNGYVLLRGKKLNKFKQIADGTFIDEGTKISVLGLFNFRAMLNFAMLLTESEAAKIIRSRTLDIVIEVIAARAGGHTKYINQRDVDFLPAAFQELNYRKAFTSALSQYLDMGGHKYGIYTNKIYQVVFKENAKEYKQILKLSEKDKVRDTMYAEVLKAIASIENGIADDMKKLSEKLNRKITAYELDGLLDNLSDNKYLMPIIEDARCKMASRDLSFRDALHKKLESYVQSVSETDFERFLGETSRSLEEQLSDPETLAVFKRLKDR